MSFGQTLDTLGTDHATVFASNEANGMVLIDLHAEYLTADEATRLGTILIQQAHEARRRAQ